METHFGHGVDAHFIRVELVLLGQQALRFHQLGPAEIFARAQGNQFEQGGRGRFGIARDGDAAKLSFPAFGDGEG